MRTNKKQTTPMTTGTPYRNTLCPLKCAVDGFDKVGSKHHSLLRGLERNGPRFIDVSRKSLAAARACQGDGMKRLGFRCITQILL
eukprot:scaffold25_cov342-Pavlova_lutheri.AAC.58